MNRRTFLALGGSVAAASAAGCLADDGSDDGGETQYQRGSPIAAAQSASEYPDYGEDVVRVVGYDAIDPEEAAAYMEPSARATTIDEPIEFTLYNRSSSRIDCNFYAWHVLKRVDGRWHHVAPLGHPSPLMSIASGSSHAWTLTPTDGVVAAGETVPTAEGTESVELPALGGGQYLFGTTGRFSEDDLDERTAFVARFELEADSLPLTPTHYIEGVSREGDVVVAESSRQVDSDYARLAAYELERVDDPDEEPRPVVTEQVVRDRHLRDALALALEHDAEHVRIEEYDATFPPFGVQDAEYYEYEGEQYRVTAGEVGGCGCE